MKISWFHRVVVVGVLCIMGAVVEAAPLKGLVCFNGQPQDNGFNSLAQKGVQQAQTDYPLNLDVTTLVAITPEAKEEARKGILSQKWDFVVGIGDDYAALLQEEAKKNAATKYTVVDTASSLNQANWHNVAFNDKEAGYLAGVIAASESTGNKIGFIGGNEKFPSQKALLKGYITGILAVKPEAEIYAYYIGNFTDSKKAGKRAEKFYNKGVDVIFHAADRASEGIIAVAAEKRKFVIGCDYDQALAQKEPAKQNSIITSALKRVDKAVYDTLQALARRKWQAGSVEYNFRNDGVGYAVNALNKDKIATWQENLADAEAKLYVQTNNDIDYTVADRVKLKK